MSDLALWTRSALGVAVSALWVACDGGSQASEVLGGTEDAAVSAYCASLEACCPTLPAEVQKSCLALAEQAGADQCEPLLVDLAKAGQCTAPVSLPDAGSGLDATVTGARDSGVAVDAAVACTLLVACCSSPALPSTQVTTCQAVQGGGDERDCASLFSDLTASNSCSGVDVGSGGACPDLLSCCTSSAFPAQLRMTCDAVGSGGDNSACAADLAEFLPAGYCGGVLPGADGGHAPDPDCTMLAMCCGEITFPESTLPTCQQVASTNDGGNCLSAYDSYSALAYCE